MTLFRVCVCLVAAAIGTSLPAQIRGRPTIPFVTPTIGIGTGSGAGFIQRNTIDLDVAGGVLFHNRRRYSLVAGGFVGATTSLNGTPLLDCTGQAALCPTYTPQVEYAGAMFGIETSPLENATAAGFAIGPTVLQTARILGTDDSNAAPSRFGGLQIRVDGVRRLRPKVRLVFAVRTMIVPNYTGRKLSLSTFGIGLRFQTFQPFN